MNKDQINSLSNDKIIQWQSEYAAQYENVPRLLESYSQVFICSDFVANLCLLKPEYLKNLVESERLYTKTTNIEELLATQFKSVKSEFDLLSVLRQFRAQEMLRIIWRDLANWSDLNETMQDLSDLADACVNLSLNYLYHSLCEEYGRPENADGIEQQLVVIAMGKLGAYELNLSSDIDLIFSYPEDGQTSSSTKSLSNTEFFVKLGQKLINSLSKQTADGFVFRVDMRLRPFGDSGSLVSSFNAMEDYYQIHGREWERYAMIKARVIAGDMQAGEKLLQTLKPFVYRRYIDYSVFESVREMKRMIHEDVKRKDKENNIKVGAGGIREIEFIGQAFQLIHGGRETQLQQRPIQTILNVLRDMDVLPSYVVEQLLEAYVFLRNTEHRIQAFRDEQSHSLPDDELNQQRLAFSMGYENWDAFNQVLLKYRQRVHEHFEQVVAAPQVQEEGSDDWYLAPLWLSELDDVQAIKQLTEFGFEQAEEVWRRLSTLKSSRAYRHLSDVGRNRTDRLMPLLISACLGTEQPDLALLRSLDVIDSIIQRTVYLSLLTENPMAMSHFVRLCAASPWITSYLSRHPLLLDELLDPRTLYEPPSREELASSLNERMASFDPLDLEYCMDGLRHFKHSQFLRIAAADVAGALPLMKVSDHLSWVAELIVEHSLTLAWQHLVAKHGRPVCTSDGKVCDTGFAVIAYGKLGGYELGYGSDLDMVFLHSGESDTLETQGKKPLILSVFFARLGQRITNILSTLTSAGMLFEVDMRLRPDGASGMLVSRISSFEKYQKEKAWTWEHQALVRARPIAGDPAVAEKFQSIRHSILCEKRDLAVLLQDITDMREKISKSKSSSDMDMFDLKLGSGGIVDIEFMVQYGVLAYAHEHPELTGYTDNIRLLMLMAKTGIMSEIDANFLSEAYRDYRARVHRLKLQEIKAIVPARDFAEQIAGVQRIWSEWLVGGLK